MNALTTFRGKRVDCNEYVIGFVNINPNTNIVSILEFKTYPDNKSTYGWFDVIPESLSIYTGLNDVNDKPIFASFEVDGKMTKGGDVFSFNYQHQIKINDFETIQMEGYFIYNRDMIRFEIRPINNKENLDKLYNLSISKLEVTGKFYENPELLETK